MIRRHSLGAAERLIAAAILCVSAILLASQAFAAGFVAQAVKTRGDIRVTRDGSDISCSMGTAIQLGDVIKTGAGARLRLRFVDGSILALGENTKLSIDLFAVDATNKSRTVVMTVLEGIVNAAAAKSGENKFDYQIKTPSGYSAVRGTKWIVGFRQSLMGVYVLNGTVEMGANSGKAPLMLNSGQWGSIDAAGALSPVQTTTPEILKAVTGATDDTAMNTTPPSTTTPSTPSTPLIPLPQITPAPTQPNTPTHANTQKGKGSQGGNSGGGYGGTGKP
jgi:hypothetical protein